MSDHFCLHEAELATLTTELKNTNELLKRLLQKYEGNGHEGIEVRLSRTEGWIKKRSKYEFVIVITILGLVVKSLWAYL